MTSKYLPIICILLISFGCSKDPVFTYDVQLNDKIVSTKIPFKKCEEIQIDKYQLLVCPLRIEQSNIKITVTAHKNDENYGTGTAITHGNHSAQYHYIYGKDDVTFYITPRL